MTRHNPAQNVFHLALCFAVACAGDPSTTDRPETSGPLKDLPAGWVYLPRSYVDVWTGAYHDAVSGAFVSFIVGERVDEIEFWTDMQPNEPDVATTSGDVEGIPYRTVRVESPRDKMVNHLETEFGQPIEELSGFARTLPPASCPSLRVVSFRPTNGDVTWAFTAASCNASQEARVTELLFSQMRIRLQTDRPDLEEQTKRLTRAQFQGLALGTKLSDLRQMLGPPADSYRVSTDGFAVIYFVSQEHVDPARNGTLVFDRLQTVIEKELE